MSNLKIYPPQKRLKKYVDAPGGKSIDELVKMADDKLEDHRPQAIAQIAQKIDELEGKLSALDPTAGEAAAKELHRYANEIYSEAGTFDLPDLSRVAYNLCELTANNAETIAEHLRALLAHVLAMRLFVQHEGRAPDQVREEIFTKLEIPEESAA
ncbi:MAG: hypothetical protein PVI23_09640 [Maricaulaceae bacterium]|jgi:hypothetical protein